jgi:hypothetical protein
MRAGVFCLSFRIWPGAQKTQRVLKRRPRPRARLQEGPQRIKAAASRSAQWGKFDARRLPEPMRQFEGGGRLRR